MKKTTLKNSLLLPVAAIFFVSICLTSCEKIQHESLSFYYDYREVPVNGTVLIGPKTGSGNYTLEVENPLLLSAEIQTGWSSATGMIAIHGRLTGNTWLTVTDNVTKEAQKLKIKVTNNYEAMRISKYYDSDKDKEFPLPPSLSGIEWICLINNNARDFYLVNKESISLTDYVLKVRGKGTYTIGTEGENYHLTLSYLVDEKGQPTLDEKSATTVSYRFFISMNDYALHRLNQNLNLGFDTSMPSNWKELIGHDWETGIKMDGVGTEYKMFGLLLPSLDMPVGFL